MSASAGDEGDRGEVHGDFSTRGDGTAEVELLVSVTSTEQPFEWRQTNKRLQDREGRGTTKQHCAPPYMYNGLS